MTLSTEIREKARELLASGQVRTVIGYEEGLRGRTRPAFVTDVDDVERLVWNRACTHNLTTYLPGRLRPPHQSNGAGPDERVAIVAKPCDSRAINVHLAEQRYTRDQLHIIGVACAGIVEGAGESRPEKDGPLQARCQACTERTPVIYDTLIGEAPPVTEVADPVGEKMAELEAMTPAGRMEFWLGHFDRCLRCYACRQVCPACNCPTCLYERDDSLWTGMAIRLQEKRAFHLGRAYHLAGRCIGCDECERVCPVNIPISLLNRCLSAELERSYGFRAGEAPVPSPVTTMLSGEEG